MSGHDNEDLIDYEDDIPNVATSTINGATSAGDVEEKDKKNFSGIHSTGFRYFFFTFACHFGFSFFLAEIFFSSRSCCVLSVTLGLNTPQKVGIFF